MSDFIYSSNPAVPGELTRHIDSIYHSEKPRVHEIHGGWGSLAVSRNLYNGFQPVETRSHVFMVIGGPVLCFAGNGFLTGDTNIEGTQAVFERYLSGKIQWDEDLSGPFIIFIIEKHTGKVICVTDLMMFIPVYKYEHNGTIMLGTHVDALAKASGQEDFIDKVSVADFILNDVVTYPYTFYQNLRQLSPATIHSFLPSAPHVVEVDQQAYWLPSETNNYKNIKHATVALREGLQDYVKRVTVSMEEVAHFISAGEDSRVVAGLLPARLRRHAYIFLDSMNREGKIARRVAHTYGSEFHAAFREETFYLEILPEASDLIGSGHHYIHVHSLGFHKGCGLDRYPAVFGGFLSDTLLKGHHVKKNTCHEHLPFLPQFEKKRYSPVDLKMRKSRKTISDSVYEKVVERRVEHFNWIQTLRPASGKESFNNWPISMHSDIAYLYSNRRLFRSYEPFMSKTVVKTSARVPTSWKLNRRLFVKGLHPFLEPSRWMLHANGRLPYYSWLLNMPIHFTIWFGRRTGKNLGFVKGNQGPWGDRQRMMTSDVWRNYVEKYSKGEEILNGIFTKSARTLLITDELTRVQKIKLLQVIYHLDSVRRCV